MTKFIGIIAILCLLFCSVGVAKAAESFSVFVETTAPENRRVEFVVRVPDLPEGKSKESLRIMVIFGGRNWPGANAMNTYRFEELADEQGLILIAPSFVNDEYWEPEVWSGQALEEGIAQVTERVGFQESLKRFYYGYSAGGQCANLFFHYAPEKVAAWGAHACGVWHEPKPEKFSVPALVTCGIEDYQRWVGIRAFLAWYRQCGNFALWKSLPGGHEFTELSRSLAIEFFRAVANGEKIQFFGDDDSLSWFAADSPEARRLDPEYTSAIYNRTILQLWRK